MPKRFRAGLVRVLAPLLCVACAAAAPAGAAPPLRWSSPTPIDPAHALRGVSCASIALCVAVDSAGHAVLSTDPAAGAGASWSRVEIDGAHPLSGISCATTGLCVAVDSEGRALTSTNPAAGAGASWSRVEIDGAHPLSGISCATTGLCVAVDSEGRALTSTNPAAGAGASWSRVEIDGAHPLSGISCATTGLCVAVDSEGRALTSTNPALGPGSWHARAIDPSLGLVSVSCTAAGFCAAVDGAGDALASANAAAEAHAGAGAGSGATWSSSPIDLATPTSVSCAATALCAAVDAAGYVLASDDPTTMPPSWPPAGVDLGRRLSAVACVPEGLCAAVDEGGDALTAEVPTPVVTTGVPSEVTQSAATLTGTVNSGDAALDGCRFEYGPTAAYGTVASCASLPAAAAAAEPASAPLTGLAANATYHYRLLASSALGTTYGLDEVFKTQSPPLAQPHPSISGIPAPGQRLSCGAGVSAAGVMLGYAWLRDLGAIAGASGSTYLVGRNDVSHHLQCRVTATNAGGSATATSAFVTIPAGGLGSISETTVTGTRAAGNGVSVTLTCSRQAAGSCTIALRLTAIETLRGTTVVAVAARRPRRVTATLGAATVRLSPGQRRTVTVSLSSTGRRLLARLRRLAVRLSVSGTVVGAIRASLESATVTLSAAGRRASGARGRAGGSVVVSHAPAARAGAAGRSAPASVLAATPYMGWDTYFAFGGHYDEATVLEQASQLVTRGLERDGYRYVWLDVGWWQGARDARGQIAVSPTQWPHGMVWLTSTLHAAGFKVGLYTDAGSEGCGGRGQGSFGHYQQDVDTFAAWGFDAVKVDFCGGVSGRGSNRPRPTRPSTQRSRTTRAAGRCCCRSATTCSRASSPPKTPVCPARASPRTPSGRAAATAGAPTPTWALPATCSSRTCCATSTPTPPGPKRPGPATGTTPTTWDPIRGCPTPSSEPSSACGRCSRLR